MDRKEAIRELTQWHNQMKSHGVPNYGKKLTAIDLAIESLVLRDKYIKAIERMIEGAKEINKFLEEAAKKSDEKHQLSGETSINDKDICEQIKKHAERIKEETDKNPNSLWSQGMRSFDGWGKLTVKLKNPDDSLLTEGVEACKEQKSKLDCISRQQAIEEIKNAFTITGWNKYASQEENVDDVERQLRRLFVGAIESLPPVTPTERTGEWEHDGSDWENRWVCSECGYKLFEEQTTYCGNCGAKMKGGTENDR